MIIHSIVAFEDIFAEDYSLNSTNIQTYRNGNSYINVENNGKVQRVKNIFSTNPSDYLNKKYQPNAIYQKFK